MNRVLAGCILIAGWLVVPAQGKVLQTSPNGFSVTHEATVAVAPQAAYDRFLKIETWWNKDHTFGGDASKLTIEARRGGCWCEALANGGFVEHMEVDSVAPGERLVLRGGLGPLHFMAVTGTMTVTFVKEGARTKVVLRYSVSGYDPDQFAKLAPAVDGVLGEQVATYARVAQ